MKKAIVWLLMAVLLLTALPVFAEEAESEEENWIPVMRVVNCKEWVSLRSAPDTKADRICKVPLGALVHDCSWYDESFILCNYNGQQGYILVDYLEEMMYVLDWQQDGCRVTAVRDRSNNKEKLTVQCLVGENDVVWEYTTEVNQIGQFDCTTAFMGGTSQDPQVMVNNSEKGLTMLELWDGTEKWTLTPDKVRLGGGLCTAVGDDGIIYLAGMDGPTPLAISPNGELLWQAQIDDPDVFWPYEIEPRMDDIVVKYGSAEMEGEPGSFYEVILDMAGTVQSIELINVG